MALEIVARNTATILKQSKLLSNTFTGRYIYLTLYRSAIRSATAELPKNNVFQL